MNINKCNRNSLLALLIILASPAVLAKPSCPGHPSCGGGGGGGGITVTFANNYAQYNSTGVSEPGQVSRFCDGSTLSPIDGTGAYECEKGGYVQIDVLGWQNIARRGEQGYCDLLNGSDLQFREFTPTRYWYANREGCDFDAGTCTVKVSMWSYRGPDTPDSHNFVNLPGGLKDIGLIGIGGIAELNAIPGEGNVFSMNQTLNIQAMTIDFAEAGKSKTLAVCQVLEGDDYNLGEIRFLTTVE
jgi:hypothetical protein